LPPGYEGRGEILFTQRGVGPMTIAMLMKNTLRAAQIQAP
jgi:5,10-methylene-tetrahydrofolate dehydrogenase/methenyl tetrahydrofolate cyclohydrolase